MEQKFCHNNLNIIISLASSMNHSNKKYPPVQFVLQYMNKVFPSGSSCKGMCIHAAVLRVRKLFRSFQHSGRFRGISVEVCL